MAAAATGGRRRRRSHYLSKVSSPSPSPAHLTLPRGAEVEVRVDREGFHGSWYEATVVDFAPADGRRVRDYTATYSHLVADDGCSALTELFPASHVRPRPPPRSKSRFRLYDIVEAFHYDGWWTGIVMPALDSPHPGPSATVTFTVGFPITRESVEFPSHLVRPRRDYVDGHWVPSRAAMDAPSYKLRTYEVGEKVEVGSYRDMYGNSWSWFPATVLRVVDELSYVVEYYGEGKATEYVHWQFIRPALEHFRRDSESESQLVPGSEVEAYCRGAWSLGEVDRVIRGKWKYKVIVGSNWKEYLLVTKAVELLKPTNNWNNCIGNQRGIVPAKRPPSANLRRVSISGESPRSPVDVTTFDGDEQHRHSHDPESPATKKWRKDLDGILADGSEHSPHCSLVMCTPLSDQNKNNLVYTDHCATQVAKTNRVMETTIPSLDYQVEHTGSDRQVDQQSGGEVDESSVFLQNAGSSQSTMDSSALRSCSASEIMLPSPPFLSSLRPDDEHLLKPANNCSGNRRIAIAKRLVNWRTPSISFENPSSPIGVTSDGDECSHDPGSLSIKESRKDLKQLDGTLAEGLEHSSMVMGAPFSDQIRNDHVCTARSTTQVVKSNPVMETTIPSIDYRVKQASGSGKSDQQAGGKVDQQAGGEVDESSVFLHHLQNAGCSLSTIDSSPLRRCSPSESLLPTPMVDGKPLFVKSLPMWPQIEAMDVFSVYPQRPHFLPLREFPPAMHEGMALGLMAVFSDLVRIIRKASIDNSMEWFEDKFSTLHHLEGHGFSVQSLHSTLTKLVEIKSQHTICLGEMDKLDVEIELETASLSRIGALLNEKDSDIAELQQKLGCLHQEIQKIAKEMETKSRKLSRFKSEQSKFKEAYGDAKLEFHSVLAALPGSS